MNLKYIYSLLAVLALFIFSYGGVEGLGLDFLFGIFFPYLAVIIFIAGFVIKVLGWGGSAVPFAIPTTCGQQKSMSWIKRNRFDNPTAKWEVVVRMALEILCFRSLFRNTKMQLSGPKILYRWEIWLWVSALAFHYAFAAVIFRHLRFFTEPVIFPVKLVEKIDSFLQVGLPVVFASGLVLLAAATYLLIRRMILPQVRYISLAADFFPLFLIIGIAVTGILMRYFTKVDIVSIKTMTMGLVTFHPVLPENIGGLFYVHLFFVCTLLAYFPFSKLMHLGGIFLSPTRNLPADTRARRHVNPWNYPVSVHTYDEYEDEFREKMVEAGLPVEKPLEKSVETSPEEVDKKE